MDINTKIHQINNSLASAMASVNLAKNLLKDLELELKKSPSVLNSKPGLVGKFMGDHVVTPDGQKFEVPANYAAKSMLVYGDTIKIVEENGEKKFKQIERVKRFRTDGIIAKKEGRWHAVTADASYRVSDAAMEYFQGKEGSLVAVLLPLDDKFVPYATLESLDGKIMGEVKKPKDEVTSISQAQVVSLAPSAQAVQEQVVAKQGQLVLAEQNVVVDQMCSPSSVEPVTAVMAESKPQVQQEPSKQVAASQQPPKASIQSSSQGQKPTSALRPKPKKPIGQPQRPAQRAPQTQQPPRPRPQTSSPVSSMPQNKPLPEQAKPDEAKTADLSRVLTDEDLR